jgi:hypothetical protein
MNSITFYRSHVKNHHYVVLIIKKNKANSQHIFVLSLIYDRNKLCRQCVREHHTVIFIFNSLFAIACSTQLADPDYSHLKHTNKRCPGFLKGRKSFPYQNKRVQYLCSVNNYINFYSIRLILVFHITFILGDFHILVSFIFYFST